MSALVSMLFAAAGTALAGLGGYLIGLRSRAQLRDALERGAESRVEAAIERVLAEARPEDEMARAVDPLALGGRPALAAILERVQAHGGYLAVALSDDAGLLVAGAGPDEVTELLAVEGAAFGSASEKVRGQRQTIIQTQPDKRWTLHRYFDVDDGPLCLSATRHGGTPRADALDGALGALERVLGQRLGATGT